VGLLGLLAPVALLWQLVPGLVVRPWAADWAADFRVEFLVQLGAVLPWAAVLAGGRGTAAWLAAGAALVQVGVWLGRAAERRARDAGAAPPP
jgi:hypothetical protein